MNPPPVSGPVALFDLLHGVTLGTIHVVAIVLGLFWVVVNFYTFYPLAQKAAEDLHLLLRRATLGTDAAEITPDGGSSQAGEGPASPGDFLEGETAPQIDVLIPAYEERTVIEQSIAAVRDARYPQERIAVTVLLEPDDEDTPVALEQLEGYYEFDVLTVPERYPGEQCKPRALDYGFERTDGEIVGVVDAEDVVDPELFQEVAAAIVDDGHTVVQGRLDMVNEDDGWLNTAFRAEFGLWFEYILPAFNRAGYPVPLGGTTCFFRRSALVAMGVKREERFGDPWEKADELWARSSGLFGRRPWSTSNVTEDFELGLFMWMDGHSVGYLDTTTAQESPVRLDNWIRQRTRWEKGKLYTLRQYLEGPTDGLRGRGHAVFQSGLPMLGPVNIFGVVVLFLIGNAAAYVPGSLIGWLLSLGLAFLVGVSTLYGVGYWSVSDTPLWTRIRRTLLVMVTIPVYWLLQWGAAIRAMWQMYNGWLHWERTTHNGRNGHGSNGHIHRFAPNAIEIDRVQKGLALVTIVLVGLGVRAYEVGSWALTAGEVGAVTAATTRPVRAVFGAAGFQQPPLYEVVLSVWVTLFGSTPASVRSLSLLFGVGTILGTYLLGRELFEESTGLMGAFVLAMSTLHIHVARVAGSAALFALLTVVSWWAFTRVGRADARTSVSYVLATAALVYTHAAGLFVLLAQWLYVGFSETRCGVALEDWGKIQAVLLAALVPAAAAVWQQLVVPGPAMVESALWADLPTRDVLMRTILGFVGYPTHYPFLVDSAAIYVVAVTLLLLGAAMLVLAIASFHPGYGFVLTARDGTAQMGVLFVVGLLGPLGVATVLPPSYDPLWALPASVALALLVAEGITNVPDRRLQAIVLVALAVSSGLLIGGYLATESVEPWDDATAHLHANAQPEDLVVVQPGWTTDAVEHYYRRAGGPPVDIVAASGGNGISAAVEGAVPPDRRIWVIHVGADAVEAGVGGLAESHVRAGTVRFGWIRLARFEPADRSAPAAQHASLPGGSDAAAPSLASIARVRSPAS